MPPAAYFFLACQKRGFSTPLSFPHGKESAVDGRKKGRQRGSCVGTNSTSLILSAACGGQASSVPLFLLFPHESLRWIRVGALAPLQTPLKRPRRGAAAPFLGFSPGLGLCGICFQIVQTRDGCVFDRPAWQSKYSAIVSNVPCVEVRLCAIRDAALAGRTAFRLPYVKYSTGADRTTCMAYRALGKPNQTAARRAFLAGSAIGEWYAEAKCFFRRDSAIWRPAVFSSISFLPRQKRYGPRSGGDGAPNSTAPSAHPKWAFGAKNKANSYPLKRRL